MKKILIAIGLITTLFCCGNAITLSAEETSTSNEISAETSEDIIVSDVETPIVDIEKEIDKYIAKIKENEVFIKVLESIITFVVVVASCAMFFKDIKKMFGITKKTESTLNNSNNLLIKQIDSSNLKYDELSAKIEKSLDIKKVLIELKNEVAKIDTITEMYNEITKIKNEITKIKKMNAIAYNANSELISSGATEEIMKLNNDETK